MVAICHTILVSKNNDHLDRLARRTWTSTGGNDAIVPPHATRWLANRTGLPVYTSAAAPDSALTVPESVLPDAAAEALCRVLGKAHVHTDRDERLGRSGGLSYLDLLRYRGVGEVAVPDAVLTPADPGQVREVLEVCAAHGVAVVPF